MINKLVKLNRNTKFFIFGLVLLSIFLVYDNFFKYNPETLTCFSDKSSKSEISSGSLSLAYQFADEPNYIVFNREGSDVSSFSIQVYSSIDSKPIIMFSEKSPSMYWYIFENSRFTLGHSSSSDKLRLVLDRKNLTAKINSYGSWNDKYPKSEISKLCIRTKYSDFISDRNKKLNSNKI